MTALLEIADLEGGYGAAPVLRGLRLSIPEGGVVALLGPNGAGKTTTLRAITGALKHSSGTVSYAGRSLIGTRPEAAARAGIAHVPEGRGTLADLTVEENLRVGGYLLGRSAALTEKLELCYTYYPILRERRRQKAGNLSGGEQQMLAISRALMLSPTLMLLDEPSLGLAPKITQQLFETLASINREQGTAILLVEQNASLALELASQAFVLESGRIVLDGVAADVRSDESLRRAYLGY
jgi:branched-chain amino acid transport system ATP-binding protein